MIRLGAQIRAARALLDWTREDLAKAAELHPNAVAYWERKASIPVGPHHEPYACWRMREALGAAGVEVFGRPSPGVRVGSERQFLDAIARARARARGDEAPEATRQNGATHGYAGDEAAVEAREG